MNTSEKSPISFQFHNNQVRTLKAEDGSIWFVAKDVFKALSIPWNGKQTLGKIPDGWWVVRNLLTTQKNQFAESGQTPKETVLINEPAVYKLAFRSNKPDADDFTNFVASEILPAIRKTGSFSVSGSVSGQDSEPEAASDLSPDEKQILVDDLFDQINDLINEADRLTIVFRNTHLLANRIINTLVLTNPDQYKPVRLRNALKNRAEVNK